MCLDNANVVIDGMTIFVVSGEWGWWPEGKHKVLRLPFTSLWVARDDISSALFNAEGGAEDAEETQGPLYLDKSG